MCFYTPENRSVAWNGLIPAVVPPCTQHRPIHLDQNKSKTSKEIIVLRTSEN